MDKRNTGMMECWNIGSKEMEFLKDPSFQSSTVPSFLHHVSHYPKAARFCHSVYFTAFFSVSTMSSFSQLNSGSSRPKWP